jgi:hypothetical protein
MFRAALLAGMVTCVGCDGGDGSASPDAPRGPDAPIRDAAVVDGQSPCGGDRPFKAKLADFDFSLTTPTVVAGATFTVQSLPSRTALSAADGVVQLCVPVEADGLQKLDVDAPGDYLDGTVIASPDASHTYLPPMILRSITLERASAFYSAQLGVAFDATRAHVIVLNACDGNEPMLDRPHGTMLVASETGGHELTWTAGTVGDYVLFPNVDVTQPTGIVSWEFLEGPHVIPLAAGRWTMIVGCIWFL